MKGSKEIGARVKEAITKSGFRQNSVAEKLGLAEDTLTSYVTGKRNIPEENLKKIAEITNVSVQWLLTGADAVFTHEEHQTIAVIRAKSMDYPSNTSNPPVIQLTEQQLIEILKFKDTHPHMYKIIEMIINRNDQLAAMVEKLQNQNEVNKQD